MIAIDDIETVIALMFLSPVVVLAIFVVASFMKPVKV